jgi:hypothetical protein
MGEGTETIAGVANEPAAKGPSVDPETGGDIASCDCLTASMAMRNVQHLTGRGPCQSKIKYISVSLIDSLASS